MTGPWVNEILVENGLAEEAASLAADWFRSQCRAGAALSLEFRNSPRNSWLGNRLFWWPQGTVPGRTVSLVTSRLGKRLDDKSTWFAVLRAACAKLGDDEWLVACKETAAGPFVERCAELFGLRLLRICLPHPAQRLSEWLKALRSVKPNERQNVRSVYISPALSPDSQAIAVLDQVPLADRAVVVAGEKIIALSIRRGGNLQRLIEARLADPSLPPGNTFVALGPDLVRQPLAAQLMDQGALGWHVLGLPTDGRRGTVEYELEDGPPAAPVIPVPDSANWQFLTHCTRRRAGAWPDQIEDEFLDDVILDRESADHSPLSALTRIIQQRKLVASSRAIRGGTAVVSLTAVPLVELPNLRTFRPHRVRWDFEPYGICIRRPLLERSGAQAVTYGDDESWNQLDIAKKPFFQVTESTTQAGQKIDWSVEQEWRVIGDIDLTPLRCDDAFVFVKTGEEATRLARICPWPVAVVES